MHQTSLRYIIIIEMLTADLSYCILVLSCLGWILTNTPDAVKIICHHSCLWCHLSWCHLSCIWCHLLPFMFVMSSFMMSSLMDMMSPVTIHVCDVIFHDVISHVYDVSLLPFMFVMSSFMMSSLMYMMSLATIHVCDVIFHDVISHVCDVSCYHSLSWCHLSHVCDVSCLVCESSFRLLGKISNKR